MNINGSSLLAQMQSMTAQATGDHVTNTTLIKPQGTSEFGNLLKQAVETVNGLQMDAKDKTNAFEMGDRSITLAEVMITKEKAGIAFDATIQVRNKLVEAYKEIMSMPV